jgi:hypothetical protein
MQTHEFHFDAKLFEVRKLSVSIQHLFRTLYTIASYITHVISEIGDDAMMIMTHFMFRFTRISILVKRKELTGTTVNSGLDVTNRDVIVVKIEAKVSQSRKANCDMPI